MAEQTVSISHAQSNNEEWRAVPGYEGLYDVSDLGRVRRVARWQSPAGAHDRIWVREKILRPGSQDGWLYYVSLRRDGASKSHTVHKLVLTAFVGPRPNSMEGSHLDGDPSNNRPSNLIWETHAENIRRKADHGTQHKGEQIASAKLTETEVREIIRLRRLGELTCKRIGQRFGIGHAQVSRITNGHRWQHLNAT